MSKRELAGGLVAIAIVLFALWFRLEYQANTIVDEPMRADAGQYTRIGMNIVRHGVVSMDLPGESTPSPDSYRGPGYPLLVALAMQLRGEEGWYHFMLGIQAVLGALSVVLTMLIARYWLPVGYALAAGILVAVWPHLVTTGGYILTETLYGFCLLLGIYLLCRGNGTGKAFWYVLAGLVFAYAALVNPAVIPFPILISALLFVSRRKLAVLFLACSLVLPVAWSARNVMLESDRSSSGRLMENVLAGMEPEFSYVTTPSALAAYDRVRKGVSHYKDDAGAAWTAIYHRLLARPAFYANWYALEKPLRFWQWYIVHGDGDIYVYPVIVSPFQVNPLFRAVASLCMSLNPFLLMAAAGGLLVAGSRCVRRGLQRADLPLLVVALLFLYATLLHTLLTPDPRYATPFRPIEILMAVSLLATLHRRWQQSRESAIAAQK